MARPISWLPRLKDIQRSVAESVRSHYTRRDIENLFEIQPATANRLMEALPTQKVGTGLLVEREVLAKFLEDVQLSADVDAVIKSWRQRKSVPSRRALRSLVRRDLPQLAIGSLPANVTLEKGRVQVTFGTLDELVESLFILAQVLNDDLEEFSRRYEEQKTRDNADSKDIRRLFEKLERDEQAHHERHEARACRRSA